MNPLIEMGTLLWRIGSAQRYNVLEQLNLMIIKSNGYVIAYWLVLIAATAAFYKLFWSYCVIARQTSQGTEYTFSVGFLSTRLEIKGSSRFMQLMIFCISLWMANYLVSMMALLVARTSTRKGRLGRGWHKQ
jgi:hypothetical protein